jgi:hypothetical protein
MENSLKTLTSHEAAKIMKKFFVGFAQKNLHALHGFM